MEESRTQTQLRQWHKGKLDLPPRKLRLDHPQSLCLEGHRVLCISDMEIVLADGNSSNSRPVHHAQILADMNINSDSQASSRGHMDLLEGHQLFVGSPVPSRRVGENEQAVGPISGPYIFHIHVDSQGEAVAFCVGHPDCLAPDGCVWGLMVTMQGH